MRGLRFENHRSLEVALDTDDIAAWLGEGKGTVAAYAAAAAAAVGVVFTAGLDGSFQAVVLVNGDGQCWDGEAVVAEKGGIVGFQRGWDGGDGGGGGVAMAWVAEC